MEKICDTSIHQAICRVINGDHALVEKVKLLNRKLLDNPNLQDPLENQLRYAVFSSGRKWIADTISINTGMAVVFLSRKELLALESPFADISMKMLVNAYAKANKKKKGFCLKGLVKTKEDVSYVHKLTKHYEKNPELDLFKSTLVKDNKVMDGTHRLIAVLLSKLKPSGLQVFHWL